MSAKLASRMDLSRRFAGEVAVITGGAGGIGRAIAHRLAREGATVAILDKNEDGAREVVACLVADHYDAIALVCDVTSRVQVRSALESVIAECGSFTVLINNAGVVKRAPFLDLSDELWASLLGVNLTGTFIVAQEAARSMVKRGKGRIVNMASVAGEIAHGDQTAYSVSKAGS